ncbi:DUF397 domain-containing protein [Actinopolymorpha pittospori]|jgi:hypothetical protein|uniref:DUF397 domain-containing protein n=1 Tax=Actinopolymorpha pittospori TaxID=648752 RepID=A0A927NAN4_9ACTN|nr:DUF397 domain-containing protein [Actinopolymorpha pittospori]MBE1611380.1 hypothetical protein [Actinopolymorpha pittospori]
MTEQTEGVTHPLKGVFDLGRAEWRSAAAGGDIEVAFVDELIGMRNAHDPDGPVLVFTPGEWEAFLSGAKDGEFDPTELDLPLPEGSRAGSG